MIAAKIGLAMLRHVRCPVPGRPSSRWVKRLGKDDQLVEWFKPKERPRWMDRAEYDSLPESSLVREVRRTVRAPGGGKVTLTVVTTLADAKRYPPSALMGLRLRRWDVETNISWLPAPLRRLCQSM